MMLKQQTTRMLQQQLLVIKLILQAPSVTCAMGRTQVPLVGFFFKQGDPSVTLERCRGVCLTTTIGFATVSRRCALDSPAPGCIYNSEEQFVCNYVCNSDRCNGANVLPPETTSPPDGATFISYNGWLIFSSVFCMITVLQFNVKA